MAKPKDEKEEPIDSEFAEVDEPIDNPPFDTVEDDEGDDEDDKETGEEQNG